MIRALIDMPNVVGGVVAAASVVLLMLVGLAIADHIKRNGRL